MTASQLSLSADDESTTSACDEGGGMMRGRGEAEGSAEEWRRGERRQRGGTRRGTEIEYE